MWGYRENLGPICCGTLDWSRSLSGPQFTHLLNGVNHPALSASWVERKIQSENRSECSVIYNAVIIITVILGITLPSFTLSNTHFDPYNLALICMLIKLKKLTAEINLPSHCKPPPNICGPRPLLAHP